MKNNNKYSQVVLLVEI